MNKPICFVDLDDTLFQTQAKMTKHRLADPYCIAAVSPEGAPRSFMTQEQSHFVDWLSSSTHFIPVTARSSRELSLVSLRFNSWKVVAHGGVIITPTGEAESVWRNDVVMKLNEYGTQLNAMYQFLIRKQPEGQDIAVYLYTEYENVPIYLSVKLGEYCPLDIADSLVKEMHSEFDMRRYRVHVNENNIHWLPCCIDKGHAVEYLLKILKNEYGQIPVLGFADSINDFGFLKHCSWFGIPQYSQLAALTKNNLSV
ncbi:hypothetical protein JBO49_16215 [Serratia fonticola]|uniref:hypothetical protein n=1 Tax=Serratia fonticola TaxID=47917 RepID=UPI00192CB2A0|nr:hypothetical protein [Serratia fonticola]MBL5862150.1 hypothetical protein [Serratia fonticola]